MPSDRGTGVLGEAGMRSGVRGGGNGERVEQHVGVQVAMGRTYGQISGIPVGRN